MRMGSADRSDRAGGAPPPADHPRLQPPPPAAAACRRPTPPHPRSARSSRRLTLDEKFALCRSVGEECVQEEELRRLLEKKPNPVAYDGFEPSGRMHIAQASGTLWLECRLALLSLAGAVAACAA